MAPEVEKARFAVRQVPPEAEPDAAPAPEAAPDPDAVPEWLESVLAFAVPLPLPLPEPFAESSAPPESSAEEAGALADESLSPAAEPAFVEEPLPQAVSETPAARATSVRAEIFLRCIASP
ncbi:hypothetical protein GCM10023082_37730 [Streptomyces tremellae]|uniref:Uncharacterized protein n=1 Tax=Streptomyces tremellae TaxID=1124239 RepID=A0ABP7FEF7_9ACTN